MFTPPKSNILKDHLHATLEKIKALKWEDVWTSANRRKALMAILYTGLAGILAIVVLFFAVKWEWLGKLPNEREIAGIRNHIASEIYGDKDVLIGKYYIENRTQVVYKEISENVVHALIATEDARFYQHSGVDTRSLVRVGVKSLLLQKESSGGGSTISQQLAKNLFPRKRYKLLSLPINKFREMLIARRLERVYSKEDIITLYLNTVSFGEKAYGIQVASNRFFGKNPQDLELQEAATLVGLLKATTYYNPRLYPDRALLRRNVVLDQMTKYNYLIPSRRDSLQSLELGLSYQNMTHNDGLAPYFRTYLKQEIKKKLEGMDYNIYTDGLKIYTTIDERLQKHAEEAMREEMAKIQANFKKDWGKRTPWRKGDKVIERAMKRSDRYKMLKRMGKSETEILEDFKQVIPMQIFDWEGEKVVEMSPLDSLDYYSKILNMGLLSMNPKSGFIKAWVGGINHRFFQYDHVLSRRQVGSTFKPIVYAAAIDKGIPPCTYYANEKKVYEQYENWTPGNSNGVYEGYYSLEGALSKSVNTVAVQVFFDTGIDTVKQMARALGLKGDLPDGPAMALGAADLSLYDMVGVYAPLANQGRPVEPVIIKKIEDASGKVLFEAKRVRPEALA